MIDPTPNEQAAIDAAGAQAGSYLDSIGKTDLAKLTADEWRTFCTAMVGGYVETLQAMARTEEERMATIQKGGIPYAPAE
jgi:hypothetical protein